MATFVYTAKKSTAETVTGQINAETEDEAIELINQLGFLPVSVEESDKKKLEQSVLSSEEFKSGKKVKIKELYLFSRQLANLLKSGVSILRSLTLIADQTQNKFLKKVILWIALEIKNGKSFSDCLSIFPNIFSSLYVTMVKAGEESGNLQEMLVNIATYQKQQGELLSKVRTALVYPMVMAGVGLATVWFILTFVLPKMAGLFTSIGDDLPLPTKVLLSISHYLNKGWIGVIIGLVIIVFSIRHFIQTPVGRSMMSRMSLKLPIFGKIILKAELARFCRTLVLLLKSGVSLIRALPITIPILSNELIKTQLNQCQKDLMGGGAFGSSLRQSSAIPVMMGHLISIGEESGNLHEVLGEIADTYEQETSEQIQIMTTLLEPIMILTIGLIVGFIVFAILLPIFQVEVL